MSNWSVYLLVSVGPSDAGGGASSVRTYVGSTTDVHRRLRQHNSEIRGGARSTRGRKWELVCWVSGFEGRSSACRWEKLVKSRCHGLEKRRAGLVGIHEQKCPEYRNRPKYEVPWGLWYHDNKTGSSTAPGGLAQ